MGEEAQYSHSTLWLAKWEKCFIATANTYLRGYNLTESDASFPLIVSLGHYLILLSWVRAQTGRYVQWT